MNLDPREIANLYNTVWFEPGSLKVVAGLYLNAIDHQHGSSVYYRLQRFSSPPDLTVIWAMDFLFTARAPGIYPSVELLKHKDTGYAPGRVLGSYQYFRGKLDISKVKGDLRQFEKDWVLLRLFSHEFTRDPIG